MVHDHQPPPPVKKSRMKRSCSEWELMFCSLSMDPSGKTMAQFGHLRNLIHHQGEASMKIALRFRVRVTPERAIQSLWSMWRVWVGPIDPRDEERS